jgi:hypothetical protein
MLSSSEKVKNIYHNKLRIPVNCNWNPDSFKSFSSLKLPARLWAHPTSY